MGNIMSTISPASCQELRQEFENVLQASHDLTDWCDRIITNEPYVKLFNDVLVVERKVENWISTQQATIELAMEEFDTMVRDIYKAKVIVIAREMRDKLRRHYRVAYREHRIFMRSLKKFAKKHRKIHEDLLILNDFSPNRLVTYARELPKYREEVSKNTRKMEKKDIEYRRLNAQFGSKVSEIDEKIEEKCTKKVEELIRFSRSRQVAEENIL